VKKLDLRRSLRLTVAEGRLILDALDAAKFPAANLRVKVLDAITRATHTCDRKGPMKRCSVCDQHQDNVRRVRERQAADFRQRLKDSSELQEKLRERAREEAKKETPAPLKMANYRRAQP
jgi:hypothetical protein